MYGAEHIRTVHLEISTLCNASCPMCLRSVKGGAVNPQLPLRDLRIEEIRTIFPEAFLLRLSRIYLCGNYGDPMTGRDTLPAFAYFRHTNPALRLEMMTNGSARPPEWWRELARLHVKVSFGIDGLADTSALYRRGTQFERVMENASEFIRAGGEAQWDYIVFRHNEHQVEAAEALARKMGFASFRPKRTGRFFSNQSGEFKEAQEVCGESGEVEYFLEKPQAAAFRNSSLEREAELRAQFGSFENYLDQTPVHCKVAAEKSIFVSAEGLVFPCCWTAIQLYPWYAKPGSTEIARLLAEVPGGKESLSALHRSLAEILSGPFFRSLPERWHRESIATGKLKVCARICGKEFDPFRDQFQEGRP